jgi:hypothetical protein
VAPVVSSRLGNAISSLNAKTATTLHRHRIVAVARKSTQNKLRICGAVPNAFETFVDEQWERFERVAQAIRSMGGTPMTHTQADRLSKRFDVHRSNIYRYRCRRTNNLQI